MYTQLLFTMRKKVEVDQYGVIYVYVRQNHQSIFLEAFSKFLNSV